MNRVRAVFALTLCALVVASSGLRADVRSDQKARVQIAGVLGRMYNMFGGKSAREGMTTTIAVKQDRKATTTDTTEQIVDLAEEKIYDIDLKKKSYTVTTFAELRRRMEEARRKAEEDARKEAGREPETPATADPNATQVEIDVDVKNTGAKKSINGFDAHETVITVTVREKGKTLEQGGGLVGTSDIWLAASIPAIKEIADFEARYAKQLYGAMLTGVSADIARASEHDRRLTRRTAAPLAWPTMCGINAHLMASLQGRVACDQHTGFEDADLVDHAVHFENPAPCCVRHAVGVAADADHALVGDAPLQPEHGPVRQQRQ